MHTHEHKPPPAQAAAYPMFPDEDAELYVEWDEYGAKLGKEEFRVREGARAGGSVFVFSSVWAKGMWQLRSGVCGWVPRHV